MMMVAVAVTTAATVNGCWRCVREQEREREWGQGKRESEFGERKREKGEEG